MDEKRVKTSAGTISLIIFGPLGKNKKFVSVDY